jgi:glycogen debranching enzyme
MTVASALKKVATKLDPTAKSDTTSNGHGKPTGIDIPSSDGHTAQPSLKTPKTPQDEAIAFFSGKGDGEAVDVYELWLEHDGSPGQGKDVGLLSCTGLAEGG